MKKLIKLTSLALVLVIISTACSKEKRIERRLSSRSGQWNIASFQEDYYEYGQLQDSYTYSNYGNFVFDEDGTIIETFTQDGETYTSAGTWSNTEDKLTLIDDGDAIVFEIKEYNRKEMTLEYVDAYSDGISDYKDVITMKLKREN